VHGFENLRVNDASLLPWAPGINPQGTLMAIAHRNVEAFLTEKQTSDQRNVRSVDDISASQR
jgi:choline dehydrogenase-like flavoprotein